MDYKWADKVFNPWVSHTSEGQLVHTRASAADWRRPLYWNRQAEAESRRYRVFCAPAADAFEDNDQLIDWRIELFELTKETPNLDWQILTKRPEVAGRFFGLRRDFLGANIWLGVSVEDQKTADTRIPELIRIPAALRFLRVKPLLGPVNLTGNDERAVWPWFEARAEGHGVDWVIVGGESGRNARPAHPGWVRSIRDDCRAAGVPFFFEGWGEWALKQRDTPIIRAGEVVGWKDSRRSSDFGVLSLDGTWYHQHTGWNGRPMDPDTGEAYMVRVGREAAGRLLDGKEWNEFPEPTEVYRLT